MFRGQFEHAIDAKGRTSVPARFRELLAPSDDPRFILAPSPLDACLDAFPIHAWEQIEAKVDQMKSFDPNVVRFRRLYLSGAVECEVDKVGRVLVPSSLRAHASLVKEVRWAGMGRKFELWAPEKWVEVNTLDAEAKADFRRALAEQLDI
jgi:MraZ protein